MSEATQARTGASCLFRCRHHCGLVYVGWLFVCFVTSVAKTWLKVLWFVFIFLIQKYLSLSSNNSVVNVPGQLSSPDSCLTLVVAFITTSLSLEATAVRAHGSSPPCTRLRQMFSGQAVSQYFCRGNIESRQIQKIILNPCSFGCLVLPQTENDSISA